ncbi:MAG: hypothetical protein ACYTG0_12365, partial [Planctomycetota bacterium]
PGSEIPDFPDELAPPVVEVPGLDAPREKPPLRPEEGLTPEIPNVLPGPNGQDIEEMPSPDDRGGARGDGVDNTRVAFITLNERLTAGLNSDRRRGHEGIVAVIEPRDEQGRLVDAVAGVSVVVLDPALPGEAARVGRWDFTAADTAEWYRNSPPSRGLRLEMPWPDVPPVHGQLHLFVRYKTDDGRHLEAQQPIEIDVPAMAAGQSPEMTSADQGTAPLWRPKTTDDAPEPPLLEAPRLASQPLRGTSPPPAHTPRGRSETAVGRPEPVREPGQIPRPSTSPARRRPSWSPDRP